MINTKHFLTVVLLAGLGYSAAACDGGPTGCKPATSDAQPSAHRTIIDGALREALAMRVVTRTRSERITMLVNQKIMPVVKAANPTLITTKEVYSHCPSGFRQVLGTNESTKKEGAADYNIALGKIIYKNGCTATQEICEFKIDINTSAVWLKDKDTKEFMTLDAWTVSKRKAPGSAG